jgi:glycosyltransferase involved in cell wall biosynthesis
VIASSHPRVLHIVRRLGTGGLEVGVVNVVQGLERLGFAQAVCCLEDRGELADRLPASVPVWVCADGSRSQKLPWLASWHIRRWRPDVLHARNGGAWIDAVAAWFLAGCGGRLVFSFHGWTLLDRVPWRQALLLRQLVRVTSALAAVSAETARQFAEETGIPASRFTVLSSGVDTDRFCPPAGPRQESGRIVLGCVGRLHPVKAHDVLIEAFARALGDGTRDLELRLLGDGPCRHPLDRLVRERGLADHVRFCGMASDVSEQLRQLDFFVLASHREGRPTSIMEAMASGLPVVATRVGSVPDLVADGRTGLLVDPGDAAGLAQAISSLANAADLRRRFGAEARLVAVEELSLNRMIDQYATFYRGVADGRSPQSTRQL